MSPLCFRAGHELEKGWGWWLPFWVIPCSTCTDDVWKHARIFVAKFLKFSQQRKATTTWTCYFCILTCLLSHFCFPHNMWLVASAVPSAEMAIQLCPKSFFKTENRTTVECHIWTMITCSMQEMFQMSQVLISMQVGEHKPARLSVSFWSEQRSHSCTSLQSSAQPVIARYNLWV